MPIIENYDGTFDLRGAKSGEAVRFSDGRVATLRVEKVDPEREAWLSQRKDRDNYFRVTFKTTCARCNAEFSFNRGSALARASLPKTCKKHRGLSEAAYKTLQQKGLLEKVEGKILEGKHPVFYPQKLERGGVVMFRNLGYVILNVREHTSKRSGKTSLLLDLSGRCVVCGKEFPHTTTTRGQALPLRCEKCQEETGSAWRYSPLKDTGSPQYLGVDSSRGPDRTALVFVDTNGVRRVLYDEEARRFLDEELKAVKAAGWNEMKKRYGSLLEYNKAKGREDEMDTQA